MRKVTVQQVHFAHFLYPMPQDLRDGTLNKEEQYEKIHTRVGSGNHQQPRHPL